MIGCTGLLAESGIPRTRAGRHRQRTRRAASPGLRGGPSTATTPWTKSTATTTGARPLMRPGRFHLAGRMTPHGCRPRAGHLPSIALRAGAVTAARLTAKTSLLAGRRLVAGPDPPSALRAGAARPDLLTRKCATSPTVGSLSARFHQPFSGQCYLIAGGASSHDERRAKVGSGSADCSRAGASPWVRFSLVFATALDSWERAPHSAGPREPAGRIQDPAGPAGPR